MEKILLKAVEREEKGKNACKRLRKEGKIPAVVYKEGKTGLNVTVDRKELWAALRTEAGMNAIITIDITKNNDKETKKTVIVSDVQLDPIRDDFVHVDFHEISLKEKLKVKVPIMVKGEAVGVKEDNGVLAQVEWEVEVECLPTSIPEHIDIHVEEMRIGDAIHVKDVALEEGVSIIADPEQVLLTVNPPAAEAVEEEGAEEEVEEGSEPEVIKKGKKEEEEAAEGEEA